jgi:hypothetical protein
VSKDDSGVALGAADRAEDESCFVHAGVARFKIKPAEDAVQEDGGFGQVEGAARAAMCSGAEWEINITSNRPHA